MSRNLLAVFAFALVARFTVAQEKVVATGEYGQLGANGPVRMDDGSGRWIATDRGNGETKIHHKKGQIEMSYTINEKGVPVASRMSTARDNKEVISISCVFHPTSMECTDELTKTKTSLDLKSPYVFLPALEGSDPFLMLTMAATGAVKTPGRLTELAEVEFEDRSDNQLRLVSTEVEQVKYEGRRNCITPIGKVSCDEVSLDDMRIRIADSGLLLSTGSVKENSMELISIKDDSHRLLATTKNHQTTPTKK